jgi:hypothetical protein
MNSRQYYLDVPGLTESRSDSPTNAVQYCVLDNETRVIYSDQPWLASGKVLDGDNGCSEEARIQQRTVTIIYGEWTDVSHD